MEGTAIAVLASLRLGESDAADAVFDALVAESRTMLMRLGPTQPPRGSSIVRRDLSAAAGTELSAACHAGSAGNPFLLSELLTALRAEPTDPARLPAEHVAKLRPDAVTRAVLARLRSLFDPGRAVARAVAVLGGHAQTHDAATLAELSPDLMIRGVTRCRGLLSPGFARVGGDNRALPSLYASRTRNS